MSSKRILITLVFLACNTLFSQEYSSLWKGHFSYLDIIDFSKSEEEIYVASENAIFIYNISTFEIEEISTVNGISGQNISTIYYSENYDLLLIGYVNGLIEIVSNNHSEVLSVIDILDKPTIAPNIKRINHFNEYNNLIYISTDYGISVYDLEELEFLDSYFIGNSSTYIEVNETAIKDGFIYAACGSNNGIKKAELSNPNLINFSEWQTISNGNNYLSIANANDNLYVVRDNKVLYRLQNDNLTSLFTYPLVPLNTRFVFDKLTVTTLNKVYVYDSNFNQIAVATTNAEFNTQFSSAIVNNLDEIFIGTRSVISTGKPGYGVLKAAVNNITEYQEIHPQGPFLNKIFSIETPPNEIWAVFGGYSNTYNLNGGIARTGISHYKDGQWINKPYDSIAAVLTNPNHLSHIAVNPFNPSRVFISSYFSGLIELNDDEITTIYNQSNSTIVPFAGNFHLALVTGYDRNGALWVTNGRVTNPLNKFENEQWASYDFSSVFDPPTSNIGFSSIEIDSQNNVFLGSYGYGVVGFNINNGNNLLNYVSTLEQNLPSKHIQSLALDQNNQLWIGTDKGLRILYNTSNFLENPTPSVNEIVFLDDGIPKELLSNQAISSIEVDGSNNKWIGTGTSGVFYFSPDGQETIYHFTTDNSPLPSNTINDISIDAQNGRVYIATDKGMVSFLSGGSKPEEELVNAYVYPNPVRPEYNVLGANNLNDINKGVKIKGLTENVNVKITDIEGNLVAEAQSRVNLRSSMANYNFAIDGGTAIWNGKNLANNIVASGVYLILISDLDSFETKVLKLLIVR